MAMIYYEKLDRYDVCHIFNTRHLMKLPLPGYPMGVIQYVRHRNWKEIWPPMNCERSPLLKQLLVTVFKHYTQI